MSGVGSVLLFDGVCNLCSGFVRFAISQDPKKIFKFSSLQSEAGQNLLKTYGLESENFKSIVLIENGRVYIKSAAVLRFLKKLKGAWPLLYGFIIIPRPIRDFFYDKVAANRYRWFGKKDMCWMPTRELEDRFLK